jgi:STE24 endopeptidase
VRSAVGVLVVAALAVGAVLLYRTAVPHDLQLPEVDAKEVFGEELVEDAERYERFLYVLWVLATLALLGALLVYAHRGAAYARESAAGPIGTGILLGMLGLAVVWLVRLPFGLAALWWGRRHELTELGYVEWLFADWGVLLGEVVAICVALVIVMGLARRFGEHWWLPGAGAFVGIAAAFLLVMPYLATGSEHLANEALVEAGDRFEQELGLPDIPIRVDEVSDEWKQANAYAYGIGPSRRVVFWDTMLQQPFDGDEQQVVLAHELAHHSQDHLPKGIGWFAIFAFPGAWILMQSTRGRGGMGQPEAVPLALLVVVIMQLVAAPTANWLSRRMEAEADWKALQVTRDPDALEGVMVGISETSLAEPDPPGWIQFLTGTHPTLEDRVAMARAWAARRGDR